MNGIKRNHTHYTHTNNVRNSLKRKRCEIQAKTTLCCSQNCWPSQDDVVLLPNWLLVFFLRCSSSLHLFAVTSFMFHRFQWYASEVCAMCEFLFKLKMIHRLNMRFCSVIYHILCDSVCLAHTACNMLSNWQRNSSIKLTCY